MNFSRKPYPVQIHPDPIYVNKHVKAPRNAARMAETITTHEPTSQSRSKLHSFAVHTPQLCLGQSVTWG